MDVLFLISSFICQRGQLIFEENLPVKPANPSNGANVPILFSLKTQEGHRKVCTIGVCEISAAVSPDRSLQVSMRLKLLVSSNHFT